MRSSAAVVTLLAASVLGPGRAVAAPPSASLSDPLAPVATSLPIAPAPQPEAPRSPEPDATAALLAGAATALIPLTLGGVLASSGTSNAEKNTGLILAGTGFTLAPLVSHAVHGEWKRGLLFTALPAVTEAAMIAILRTREDAVFKGTTLSRTTFGVLFSIDVFASAFGLVDSVLLGDRSRGRGFVLAPTISRSCVGLTLGGSL